MTVIELTNLWLDTIRPGAKPRTVSEYERIIAATITPHIGTTPVQKITASSIDHLYATLRGEGASEDKVTPLPPAARADVRVRRQVAHPLCIPDERH